MNPKRFAVKYFVNHPDAVHLPAIVPVFHRWIQNHTVEGLLIDVADYKHVPNGPGILLIGHEGDYALDMGHGRPGLRYDRKHDLRDSLADSLREAFRLAQTACRRLETEPALNLTFNPAEAEIIFLDRLATPNNLDGFETVKESVRAVANELYPGQDVTLQTVAPDPRRPLTIRISAAPAN